MANRKAKSTDNEIVEERQNPKVEAAEQPALTPAAQLVEDAAGDVEAPDELVSEGTRRNAANDVAYEELRKARTLKAEAEVAKAKEKEEEERVVTSEASEDQYTVRLRELEEASVDLHLPYNERLRAREAADLLRGVVNDMKGDGDPAGPTLATFERKSQRFVPTIGTAEVR